MINVDKKFWDCCSIDTETWLDRVLGRELDYECSGDWLMQQEYKLLEYIETREGISYKRTSVDNVYNYEQDFSSVFQFQIFYPDDGRDRDHFYSDDTYVAVEVHKGGDVRGNYGRVRLYKVDSLADTGFYDWVVGWRIEYSDGENADDHGRFDVGYSSHPTSELSRYLKCGKLHWSEKRQAFIGMLQGDRAVAAYPDCRVY